MSKRTLLLLIAAVIAAFTALSVKNYLSQTPVEEPVAQAARVLIAKRDLSPGSFVQAAQDLDWGTPPVAPVVPEAPAKDESSSDTVNEIVKADNASKDTVPKEAYLYEGTVKMMDFNGAVVRRQLHAGDPVPASALMKAGTGGLLSAVLNPGMRAVSISVQPNTNGAAFVSGFVLPGDYVDLIATREVDVNAQNHQVSGNIKTVFSKTFIQNVRVLAADQALDNPDNKAMVSKTITVEVTPTQAQEIAMAAEMGKILVSLRSAVREQLTADDNGDVNSLPSLSDMDLGILPKSHATQQIQHQQVKLFRPKETQNLEFDSQDNGMVMPDTTSMPASPDLKGLH